MPAWCAAVAGLCLLVAVPAAAGGQEAPRLVDFTPSRGFLTGFNFLIGIEALSPRDSWYHWDADFAGDIDVMHWDGVRVNVFAEYEAVLGRQFQHFDPIFSNYTIDVLGGYQFGPSSEMAVLLRHVSRHLGDRPKGFLITWNQLGGQYTRQWRGRSALQLRLRGLAVFNRYFVDNRGEVGGDFVWRRPFSPRVALVTGGGLRGVFFEEAIFGRAAELGGRAEVGVRLQGRGAAVEFYGAVDRRVDPNPLRPGAELWGLAGLRFVSPR
jgi:hypothetical protein